MNMQDGLTLMPIILHPRSVGTVRLHSSSPHDPPIIDPQFLTADEDVKTAISGNLHTLLELIEQLSLLPCKLFAANLDYLYDAIIVLILFSLIIERHERLQLKVICEKLRHGCAILLKLQIPQTNMHPKSSCIHFCMVNE